MNENDIFKKVRKIELRTKHLVESNLYGAYYSVFKGRGIEFSEVREYRHGDDIRSIDWNVTARMNRPFVKEFVEERDLTVMILFDISGSSEFGTQEMLKKEAAIELIASIAFSAVKSNDRTGLILSTDRVEKYIPPRKGRKHILRIVREMLYFKPAGRATSLSTALMYISKIMKKRGIIFIVSDFIDELERIEKPLRIIKRKHDVIAVKVSDIREQEIPDVGYINLEDSETGEVLTINTSDPAFRKAFSEIMSRRREEITSFMKRNNIDLIEMPASGEWQKTAIKFFRERARRML